MASIGDVVALSKSDVGLQDLTLKPYRAVSQEGTGDRRRGMTLAKSIQASVNERFWIVLEPEPEPVVV